MSLAPWEILKFEQFTNPYVELLDLPELDVEQIKQLFPGRKHPDKLDPIDSIADLLNGNSDNDDEDDDGYPGATNFS